MQKQRVDAQFARCYYDIYLHTHFYMEIEHNHNNFDPINKYTIDML